MKNSFFQIFFNASIFLANKGLLGACLGCADAEAGAIECPGCLAGQSGSISTSCVSCAAGQYAVSYNLFLAPNTAAIDIVLTFYSLFVLLFY